MCVFLREDVCERVREGMYERVSVCEGGCEREGVCARCKRTYLIE